MKVKDLIKILEKVDGDTHIVLSSDEEGNCYRYAYKAEEGVFDDGCCYSPKWSADDCCLDEEDWKALKEDKSKKCIVLFP